MKRSGFKVRQRAPMRRTGRLRVKRLKPGVTGRAALSAADWDRLKGKLWQRARGRCEVSWCRTMREPLDPHHVVKRSQGGPDTLDNLTLLCRRHHDMTDWPYVRGRLTVVMLRGQPKFTVAYQEEANG